MKNQMPIFQAMYIAEDVARIILDYSFRESSFDYGVHDVMLFGSTLTGEAHNIDMLIIHNITQLDLPLSVWPVNPDSKKERPGYINELILNALGAPAFMGFHGTVSSICAPFDSNLRFNMKPKLNYPYTGKVDVPEFGQIHIENAQGWYHVSIQVENQVRKTLEQEMVVTKVQKLLEQRGLNLGSLDLMLMNRRLLLPNRPDCESTRNDKIRRCTDRTFWPSILESGRIYNKETRHFDMRINDKYPGAVELFQGCLSSLDSSPYVERYSVCK